MQRSEEHQGFEAQQPQQPQSSQSDEFQLSPEAIAAIKEYDQKIAKTPSLYEKKRVIYDSQISSSDPTYIGLSIDGGGIRGLLPAIMLQHLEDDHLGKTTNLWRAFDYIGGTSVGGIIALGIANDIRASDLVKLLEDRAEEVFSKRWVSYIPGSSLFTYPYDPQSLENVLKETFKETELHEAKTPVLVTSCTAQGLPFLFESKGPTQDYRMWEAARCTSAAPTYFKGFELPITKCRKTDQISRYVGDGTRPSNSNWSGPTYSWRVDHQLNSVVRDDGGSPVNSRQSPSVECTNHGSVTLVDGGLWVNNPSMLVLGSLLRDHQPNFRQTYLLSLGTGQADPSSRPIMPVGAGKLFAIKPTIESLMESKSLATDIAIESLFDAHTDANIKNASQDYKIMYKGFGSYSMPKRQLNYCRLNPILERPIELDDISQKNLDYLKQTAQDPTLLRDIERFYDDVIRLKLEKDAKRNAI